MIEAFFEYQFIRHAVLTAVLSSIVCGFIGVIVIEKRLLMMSGGVAHSAYGGVGLGYLAGFEPIWGAFLFALVSAYGIGHVQKKSRDKTDVLISLLWSLGMALGILFTAIMPGYPPDMSSYLFGNILFVTRAELYLTIALSILVTFAIVMFFNHWKVFLFDEEFSSIIGVRTGLLRFVLLILIALSVVVLIRVTGIVLLLAQLAAPAATASLFTNKLKSRIVLSIIIGNIYSLVGLWLSYSIDMASGACIVILSILGYFACMGIKRIKTKSQNKQRLKNAA